MGELLTESEVPEHVIRDSKIFHFGTLSMTHEGVRKATKKTIRIAKESGALVSFDPNLRPPLWESLEDARTHVKKKPQDRKPAKQFAVLRLFSFSHG